MKRNLFSILMIIVCVVGYAQTPTITFHTMEKEKTDPRLVTYAKTENGYVILKKEPIKGPGGFRYFLDVRDENMNKVSVTNVSEPLGDENIHGGAFLIVGNQLVLFSKYTDKKRRTVEYYYQTIDVNNAEVSRRIMFYELKYMDKKNKASLSVSASKNGKFLLVLIHPPYDEDEEEVFTMYVMDENLKTFWKRENYTLDHDDKDYSIKSIRVSNKGAVYMMGKLVTDDNEDDEYDIFRFDKNGVKETVVEFGELDYRGLNMSISPKGDVCLTGYWTDEDTRGKKGIFIRRINGTTLADKGESTVEFSEDIVFLGEPTKSIEKQKKKATKKEYEIGVSNLTSDAVLYDENDNCYFVGSEYYSITTTTTNSNGGTSTSTTYYYQDIHVTKFDNEGEHVFNAKVPRRHAVKKPYDSFTWLLHDENISFVFLDNRLNVGDQSNLGPKGIVPAGKGKKNVLAVATVDSEGGIERSVLYDYPAKKHKFIIFGMYEGQDEAVISSYWGDKQFKIGFIRAD